MLFRKGFVEMRNGRMADWRNGGMAEWQNAEWQNGYDRMVEWRIDGTSYNDLYVSVYI